MTRENHWDEEKVEDQLRKLPSIEDKQNKEDLFLAIQRKMDEREENQKIIIPKKKKTWFFPAIASAVAVLLIILIVPSMFNDLQFSSNDEAAEDRASEIFELNMGDSADDADSGDMGIFVDEAEETEESVEESGDITMMEEDGTDPLTVTVPAPYIKADVNFGSSIGSFVFLKGTELLIEDAGETLEEQIYYALTDESAQEHVLFKDLQSIEIDEMNNTVTLDFSENNTLESMSSTQAQALPQAIQEVFGFYGITKVIFTTEGDLGVNFGQTGPLDDLGLYTTNRGYYLYDSGEDGEKLLFRAVGVDEWIFNEVGELLTFEETVEKMRNVADDAWYSSPIPSHLEFDIMVEDNIVFVTFEEGSALSDTRDMELFVEAILLTARDFPYDFIQFQNAQVYTVGQYQMEEPIDVRDVVPNLN
ncbi:MULTISPECIES: hypothetical protein [Bacillaceae]|uniref:GerMN domain-containing protein n=1 Tax=Evansella alkalicola TaxID=745819 RepID=A0ABS6K0C5_9BACI|nr:MULTISPECIES: hypothetical protein [Bacillaceae]MBU9723781.1 hypothetical protein [Bacillus alkalicola]